MQDIVNFINDIVWSPALIYLCLGVGLFYSIVTRFVQVRHFFEMWRLMFTGGSSTQGVSSFQALAMSLSGRVGTGNIAGVSAAIGFGGPGAVFWMWMMAFLGAATSYIECTLGQIYKEECDGQYRGGPAYYFEKATGQKWYAIIFAMATILATGLLLPGVQSNSIGNAVSLALGDDSTTSSFFGGVSYIKLVTGLILSVTLGFIIFGGTKRIALFAEIVVPFMAIGYILIALIVIGSHITLLPGIMTLIVTDAFSPMAGLGAAIGWGVKRGVYSNEAGQGTGPHSSAAAEVPHPAQQGLVQAFAVYVDTLFICTATALMILITGTYNVHGADTGIFLVQHLGTDVAANSPRFTQLALENVFPGLGKFFVALALTFFAFTTIVAYFYIAETNVAYLRRSFKVPGIMLGLKILIISSTFYGAIKTANLAWGLGDIGVGIMAWLNIVGILVIFYISRPALKALLDYEAQQKAGVKIYEFDPEKLGIKNADFWILRREKKLREIHKN
jgi:alanine or glycine:cation symporter, AGCS family